MPKPTDNGKPKRVEPTKTKVKTWLKAHGHKAADVDAKAMTDIPGDLCALHSVTLEQWRAAMG